LVERSTKKPVSLLELSCHVSETLVDDPAMATRLEGTAGGVVGVAALAVLLAGKLPALFDATM
jgi:hypothetical protein